MGRAGKEFIGMVVSLILAALGLSFSFQAYNWLASDRFGGFDTLVEKSYLNSNIPLNPIIATTKYDIALIPIVCNSRDNFRLRVYNTSSTTPVIDESYTSATTITQKNIFSLDLLNRAYFVALNPRTRFSSSLNLDTAGNYIGMDFRQIAACAFIYDAADVDDDGTLDSWYRCSSHHVWSKEANIANLPLYCSAITGNES